MSRLGFSNEVSGLSIFWGATSRFHVIVMFRLMPIAAIPLDSIYIVVSYLGGAMCAGPTLADLYRNKRHTTREDLFFRD